MRARQWTAAALVALAGIALISITGDQAGAARRRRPLTPVSVQLKWLHQAQFAGYYVAKERGYYRKEGLDVTLKAGGPDVRPEAEVSQNRSQFGVDWLSALMVSRQQDWPLTNIAQVFQESGMRLVTKRSSGIQTVEDFRGKRVGVWPRGNEYQFLALMAKVGFTPPEGFLTVVDQPFSMEPFFNDELDVAHAMTYNELDEVNTHLGHGAVRVFDYNELGVSILEDGIFASEHYLRTNPDVAVRFLRASIRGWKWAIAHPEEAGEISFAYAGEVNGGSLSHQVFMAREVARLITTTGRKRPIGYMNPALYERTWKTLVEHGVLETEPADATFNQKYWRKATGYRGR